MVNYYGRVVFVLTSRHEGPLAVVQPPQQLVILRLVELQLLYYKENNAYLIVQRDGVSLVFRKLFALNQEIFL